MTCFCMGPQDGQPFCPCVMKRSDPPVFYLYSKVDLVKKIVLEVEKANPDRSFLTFERRKIKLLEELGELSEAYLNVTNPSNNKDKTWNDVFEEAIDCLIVSIDLYLTSKPKHSSELFDIVSSYNHEAFPEFLLSIPPMMVSSESKNLEYEYQNIVKAFFEICLMNFPRLFHRFENEKYLEIIDFVTIKLNKWKNSRSSRDEESAKDDAV